MLYYKLGFEEQTRAEFARIGITGPDFVPETVQGDSNRTPSRSELEKIYRKLLREGVEDDRARILLGLGQILQERGETAEARRLLREAVELDTISAEVAVRLAQIDLQSGHVDSAFVFIQRALQIEADNVLGNLMKYQALRLLKRDAEAAVHLQWLEQMAERDNSWRYQLQRRISEPLGFQPGPELKHIVPDTVKTPTGNW